MTDETVKTDENLSKPWQFKKGFDQRRWMKGAPKKPKDKKRAEELLEHIIWDVLSEEIRNPSNGESIDRLRAMIRSMTTSRQSADKQAILDRIAGKVTQSVDVTSDGKELQQKDNNAGFERAISTLADALREIIPAKGSGQNSEVDTAK